MNETTPPSSGHRVQTPASGRHHLPSWFDEMQSALTYAAHVLCAGNVRDIYPDPVGHVPAFHNFDETLWRLLAPNGVKALLKYDPASGTSLHRGCDATIRSTLEAHGFLSERGPNSLTDLALLQQRVAAFADFPLALMIDYASQLAPARDQELTDLLVSAHRSARIVPPWRKTKRQSTLLHNPSIWLLDKAGDMPDWFTVNNPHLREISVELPDIEDRFAFALRAAAPLVQQKSIPDDDARGTLERFALECDGEQLQAIRQALRIAAVDGDGLEGLPSALRTYRTGLRRNPWASNVLRSRLQTAQDQLSNRIVGQPHAIDKTLDILSRSIMGLSGVQDGRRFSRPRGVLFFAGPTGVGKTELAKAVTELLFGNEAACHRFDMSEFMEEGSITRLIGAPPGQAGHERGGELVNAAHRRPFSVFLFDEIDKAHPRILDVFLQILDEGRLTDARGAIGHFSEALVIFTSNIGMFSGHKETNMGMDAMPSDSYRQLETKISRSVQEHFRFQLKRPELINRIGQNIVVFDFLRHSAVTKIFDTVVDRVLSAVASEHGINVTIGDEARDALTLLCTQDVFDGGRGVGNRIETHLVNPLSRALFRGDVPTQVRIERLIDRDGHTVLEFVETPDRGEGTARGSVV